MSPVLLNFKLHKLSPLLSSIEFEVEFVFVFEGVFEVGFGVEFEFTFVSVFEFVFAFGVRLVVGSCGRTRASTMSRVR